MIRLIDVKWEKVKIMNILLVDNELKIIEHVLNETDWNISVLVTTKRECKYKNEKRIKEIYEENDFWHNEDLSSFDYKDLGGLWKAQLKIENTTYREIQDFQIAKLTYYRGYALAKTIFEKEQIDIVIVKGPNHGYTYDRLLTSYASYKNIPSYNIQSQLYIQRVVYNNLDERLVKIKDNENVQFKNLLFYSTSYSKKRIPHNVWEILYKLAYRLAGRWGEELIKCVRYRNTGNDKLGVTIIEKYHQLRKIKHIKKFYCKAAVDIDYNKNYILYALHLEPEAVIAGYAEMDSQLLAIKMLAQCLPPDWILYVKEHPSQFVVNNDFAYHSYLYGTPIFKSKRFYQEILKIKNVKLLKCDIESKKIMNHSKAIATFSGTIATEAITQYIPVICFSTKETFYRYVDDVFKIGSFQDCKQAVDKIKRGFKPLYKNFKEVCGDYLLDMTDEYAGYRKAVITIKNDIEDNILHKNMVLKG